MPRGPRYLMSADLNGDGWPELIVSNYASGEVFVLSNQAGRFSPTLLGRFEMALAMAGSEGNGGGLENLVVGVRDHGTAGLALFQGQLDGTLRFSRLLQGGKLGEKLALGVAAADVTGDGITDLVVSLWDSHVLLLRGTGEGHFAEPTAVSAPVLNRPWRPFALGDVDLDGRVDVLLANSDGDALELLAGQGDGRFITAGKVFLGGLSSSPIVADFNNDGLPDLFVNPYYSGAYVFKAVPPREERR